MRIVIASNPPHGTSAYSGQTASWAPRLQALGHEVAILSTWGLYDAVIRQGGLTIYPCGIGSYGMDMVASVCQEWRADVLLSLFDPHAWGPILGGNAWSEMAPWIPWTPIDHDPPRPANVLALDWAYKTIAMSRFGKDRLDAAGIRDVTYIPHGLETGTFHPMDQRKAQQASKLPDDRYIVGFVGVNKEIPSRKGIVEAIQAFAKFRERHPDALLYLHTLRHQGMGGYDVDMLCESAGLMRERDYYCAPPFQYLSGQINTAAMATLYNAFDVLLAPSAGEGFGLPLLEAQACGVPVVSTNWTAMPENTMNGVCVEPYQRYYTHRHSWWAVPDVDGIAEALESIYQNRSSYRYGANSAIGVEWAKGHDWNRLAVESWGPYLAELEAELC